MPYSNDLRKRVIATVKAGGQSLAAIAKTFQVSESTVDKWVSRWHETGSSDALPWAGGRRRTLAPCEAYIRAAVERQPDISLQELCDQVAADKQVVATPGMMSRELALLKLPRKKRVSTTANATQRASSKNGPRSRS